jgi:hypothetical protein
MRNGGRGTETGERRPRRQVGGGGNTSDGNRDKSGGDGDTSGGDRARVDWPAGELSARGSDARGLTGELSAGGRTPVGGQRIVSQRVGRLRADWRIVGRGSNACEAARESSARGADACGLTGELSAGGRTPVVGQRIVSHGGRTAAGHARRGGSSRSSACGLIGESLAGGGAPEDDSANCQPRGRASVDRPGKRTTPAGGESGGRHLGAARGGGAGPRLHGRERSVTSMVYPKRVKGKLAPPRLR